jgi:putative GTP pyrophosphokinase
MSLDQDYTKRHAEALVPMAKALSALLEQYCVGLERIDRISARAKGVKRFIAKASKLDKTGKPKYSDPLQEIQDQIGARIITFYPADVDHVERQVCPYFRPVEQKSLIPESENEFGYVGRHFILFIPTDISNGYDSDIIPQFFELQIKTLFQHAWAEGNHDLAYKPPVPITTQQKRLIAFTAAQAWGADQVFDQLYDEIINMPRITVANIDQYRGTLTIGPDDLKCDMWDIFDKTVFDKKTAVAKIVLLKEVVSTKDERTDRKFLAGMKADPRQVALGHMQNAAANKGARREPITVAEHSEGLFYVIDGNATVQVLMLAKWTEVPVCVVNQ